MSRSLTIQLKRLAHDRWSRSSIRILLRSALCGLSLWCLGLGAHLLFGWPLRVEILGILVLGCIAAGGMLLVRRRMSPYAVARRLDQRFGLNSQLTTAIEVDAKGVPEGVAVHLLDQSHRTVGRIRRYVNHHQRFPWSEVGTVVSLVLMSIGLLLLVGLGVLNLRPTADPLPPLVGAQDQEQAFPEEPFSQPESAEQQAAPPESGSQSSDSAANEGAQESISQAAALAALADALRDQSVTRSAAESLDRGDTSQAAQELRELADQAGQLSQATRNDLANALQEAAISIETENPELADRLEQNASALQQDSQRAAEAFDDLARMLEQLGEPNGGSPTQADQAQPNAGEQPQADQNQQGGGIGAGNNPLPGDQREQAQSDRLGVEGVPLELESEGEGRTSTEGDATEAESSSSGSGSFEVGASSNPDSSTIQTGEDPLRIPADLRDVVQEYFSPAE